MWRDQWVIKDIRDQRHFVFKYWNLLFETIRFTIFSQTFKKKDIGMIWSFWNIHTLANGFLVYPYSLYFVLNLKSFFNVAIFHSIGLNAITRYEKIPINRNFSTSLYQTTQNKSRLYVLFFLHLYIFITADACLSNYLSASYHSVSSLSSTLISAVDT